MQYVTELENLITDVLLPAYLEHNRLLGREVTGINERLLKLAKDKNRKVPALFKPKQYPIYDY